MAYYKVKDEKIAVYDCMDEENFSTFIWKGQTFKVHSFDKNYIRIVFYERFGEKEEMEGSITYSQFKYGAVKVKEEE